MSRAFCAILALLFSFVIPAIAGPYEDGIEAAKHGDFETSLSIFRALAEKNDAEGQNGLGVSYHNGLGVPQDYAEAVRWYRKAAEQGHAKAQLNLAGMYYSGQGVSQDILRAHMWFNLAAEGGDDTARRNLGILEKHMTDAQVAEARRMAREWTAQQEK